MISPLRRRLLTLLFLLLSCLAFAPAPVLGQTSNQLPPRWTLAEAIAFALRENPDIEIARQRIEQSRASLTMVKALDYPLINLSAEYAQTNNPMYSFGNILNQGQFTNDLDFNDPGRTDNLQMKADLFFRLYNGGRDQAAKAAAKAGVALSESEIQRVRQILGFEVVKTYQAIIQAEAMVEVRLQSLKAIAAALEVAMARFSAGDLLRQELLNLELQHSRAKENLIQAEHNVALTKKSLQNLLGLVGVRVELEPNDSFNQAIPANDDITRRFEMARLSAMEKTAAAELAKASGGRRPSVDAFAGYQYDKGFEFDGDGESWTAGLRLNYALFDGHKTGADIAKARARLAEITSLRKKIELAILLDLEQANLDFKQRVERLEVTEKMVGVAKEAARLSRERFQEGLLLASDLIDYEMRLTDAQARHLRAVAAYHVAVANYRRAAGYEQYSNDL